MGVAEVTLNEEVGEKVKRGVSDGDPEEDRLR